MDQGEDLLVRDTVKASDKSDDKESDYTDEMANVLGTLGATNILASGGVIIDASSPISVNTPSSSKKDKGKWKMTEDEQPSKEKVLEQMSVQLARDLEAKSEYEQAEVGLSHDEKVELIDELLMYQRHLAKIKKYQAQQNKPAIKTERRNFYMVILRSNAEHPSDIFTMKMEIMLEPTPNKLMVVMRMASAAVKPCPGNYLEFYLIIGSIYTDQHGTMVISTIFDEVTKTLSSISVDYYLPKPAGIPDSDSSYTWTCQDS
nr:hypothetical protein [Tanacetum cinerariifolium]